MLKTRLIPALLLKNGRCVKGVQFANWRDTGNPITNAKIYDAQGADELLFLDITAATENRSILFDLIAETAENCFMPLTVGGGVRTLEDVRKLLQAGADKVTVNTAAVQNPEFVTQAADRFGNKCIVGSIDVREEFGKHEVYTHCGTQATGGLNPVDWAIKLEKLGVGEILIT